MSDYRDDRPALRQRIEQLEAELAASKAREQELEERLKKPPVEPKPALHKFRKPPLPAVAIVGFVVVAAGLIAVVTRRTSRPEAAPPDQQATATAARTARTSEMPARVASVTCRCPTEAGSIALTYRAGSAMSIGGNTTYSLDAALRMTRPDGQERESELELNVETAPPSSLAGGDDRFLLACLPDRMVLALGHRVTAWSFEDGKQLWTSTLAAPVGSQKNGRLSLECDPVEVEKGKVRIPQPSGSIQLP